MNKTLVILEKISSTTPQFNKNTRMFVYRGQDDEYELTPSMFRCSNNNQSELLNNLSQEYTKHDYLQSSINTLTKLQHDGTPTRLLDWTTNPLVALFFACHTKPDKDGELLLFPLLTEWNHIILKCAQLICDTALYDIKHYNIESFKRDFNAPNTSDKTITFANIACIFATRFYEIGNTTGLPAPSQDTEGLMDQLEITKLYDIKFLDAIKLEVEQLYQKGYTKTVEQQLMWFLKCLYAPYLIIHAPIVTPKVNAQASMLQVCAGQVISNYTIMKHKPYVLPKELRITIDSKDKNDILKQLDVMFNINAETLLIKLN